MSMRWLLLLMFLSACTQIPLDEGSLVERPNDTTTTRPNIDRTNPPTDIPAWNVTERPPLEEREIFLDGVITSEIALEVPLNETIGEHHPIITAAEFPLLKHPPVRVDQATLAGYREELIFDHGYNTSGHIMWGEDDEDRIGTFLLFEEDRPILEYRVILDRGTWHDVQGREIQLLGHNYVVAEVTNFSVALFGTDVSNNILFEHNQSVRVNGSIRSDTEVRVLPNLIAYRLYSDDDLLLQPGETLSENVGRDRLLSAFLDMRYDGISDEGASRLFVDKRSHGYALKIDTLNGELDIPIVEEDAGQLTLGRSGEQLHINRCPSGEYCIAPNDKVLLISSRGEIFLVEYSDSDNETKELIFRSPQSRYSYEFTGHPGRNAHTTIVLGSSSFQVSVGPFDNATDSHNISIAMQREATMPLIGGYELEIMELEGNILPMELRVPRRHGYDDEDIPINLSFNGTWDVSVGGLNFIEDDDESFAVSPSGISVMLDGQDADFRLPLTRITGIVTLIS